MIRNCNSCNTYNISQQKEPMITSVPERPWQKVAVDLFDFDRK